MRLLIVIGAGASYDCLPQHVTRPYDYESNRLPLANNLFSTLPTQNSFLEKYNLMGLASPLRSRSKIQADKFDIEAELANIFEVANKRRDPNTLQHLFKARFYLHSLIKTLSKRTLNLANSHTVYVDFLYKLKNWVDESPSKRLVDIVVFNYDDLIEQAMKEVYSYDWYSKTKLRPLNAYTAGKNLNIYKPHGSINWGRKILRDDTNLSYNSLENIFNKFYELELTNTIQFIDPDIIENDNLPKQFVPAIAVPFKGKVDFAESPQSMQASMVKATQEANKIITFGWKGADEHFTDLLKTNNKIDDVYIVSPTAETFLDKVFPAEKLRRYKPTFPEFVANTEVFERVLSTFKD